MLLKENEKLVACIASMSEKKEGKRMRWIFFYRNGKGKLILFVTNSVKAKCNFEEYLIRQNYKSINFYQVKDAQFLEVGEIYNL